MSDNASLRRERSDLSPQDLDLVGTAADAISNLCNCARNVLQRINAWAAASQSQVWLKLAPHLSEDVIRQLLGGPVTPDGLFVPRLKVLLTQIEVSSATMEQLNTHFMSDPHSDQPPAWWKQNRRMRPAFHRSTGPAASGFMPP